MLVLTCIHPRKTKDNNINNNNDKIRTITRAQTNNSVHKMTISKMAITITTMNIITTNNTNNNENNKNKQQ